MNKALTPIGVESVTPSPVPENIPIKSPEDDKSYVMPSKDISPWIEVYENINNTPRQDNFSKNSIDEYNML
jgi:hypothetical protein